MDVPALLVLPMSFIWLICYGATWQAGLKPLRRDKRCTGWCKKLTFGRRFLKFWYPRCCIRVSLLVKCLFSLEPWRKSSKILPARLFPSQPLTGLSDPQHRATGEGYYGSWEWKGSAEKCLKAEKFGEETANLGFLGVHPNGQPIVSQLSSR